MGRFTSIEDIALADCALEVEGKDLDDLFETAALALADVMVDPATVPYRAQRTVTLEAPRVDLLLYDWLSELIFLKDRDGVVFREARVQIHGGGPYRADAEVRGGIIDPARTALRADAKAVTLHQFALERHADGWRARVVIDI